MKLAHAGMIATGTVLVMGIAMITPAFTQRPATVNKGILLMLSFDITHEDTKISQWCNELSSLLNRYQIKATIFISGRIAEGNPECVKSFSTNIDIGSQTYDYTNLVSLGDYARMLEEVQNGKRAVDRAGDLNTSLFKAPQGITDENIYSLLARSGIIADFSYLDHYNKFEHDQFVRYDLKVVPGSQDGLEYFSSILKNKDEKSKSVPVEITIDNSTEVREIAGFLSKLVSYEDVHFVNASDLIGVRLSEKEIH